MERSRGLALCGRFKVPKESSGEAIGEDAAKLLRRGQHFGDASTTDGVTIKNIGSQEVELA